MKKNKKIIPLFLFSVCLGVYFFSFNDVVKGPLAKKVEKKKAEWSQLEEKKVAEKDNDSGESPDSPNDTHIATNRAPSAIEKNEWKDKLENTLQKQLDVIGAVAKVKEYGQRTLKRGPASIKAKHVLISVEKGKAVSSYEAYIDADTGRILTTWNRTRFENKEPLKIKARAFRPSL